MIGATSEQETDTKRSRGRPKKYETEDDRRAADKARKRLRRKEQRDNISPQEIEAQLARASAVMTKRAEQLPPALTDVTSLDEDLRELAQTHPLCASAFQYVRDVVSGKIDVCKWVKLACERHESDLEKMSDASYPFTFDADKAERVARAMQMFKEIKGPNAGKRLRMRPWQLFFVCSVFGWVRIDSGTRRFSMAYLYVPRGNGKSTMAAPIGLVMTALDAEGGAEVYSAAVTKEQARIVWGVAKTMTDRDVTFRRRFGVDTAALAILQQSTASTFKPLSRDAQSLDGLNVHCAILDELAQHKTREVYDVIVTGMGKRKQPLLLAITTCGANQSGIGFEQWRYCQQVLQSVVTDDSCFALLYTIDDDDDWTRPETWKKANPNWDVSVMPDAIERLANKATQIASQQNAFKQKHLNVWTNADVAWMDVRHWNACADLNMSLSDFTQDDECVIGLDLASKVDIAAKIKIFRRVVDDKEHFYLFTDFWLPELAIQEARNASYAGWEIDGFIHTTPGDTTDFGVIRDSIIADDQPNFYLRDVAYDPWQALQLAKELESAGVPVIEYRATVANFSAPMKEIEALVMDRRLHHDGNPVMAWMVTNVVCHYDAKDNIYPRKERPENKIDGVVASIIALGRMMSLESMASSHGLIVL